MKLKNIFTLTLFLISISSLGQEYTFDIKNTPLDKYIQIAEKFGGKKITPTSNHISFNGEAQPLKFLKEEKKIPNLVTYLYFKQKDSVLTKVLYEWDESKYPKENNIKKSVKLQKAIVCKFKELEKIITKLYGKPEIKGNLDDIKKANSKEGLNKKNVWTPNEQVKIELYTTISNHYEKRGVITIKPTHRIRLYLRLKK